MNKHARDEMRLATVIGGISFVLFSCCAAYVFLVAGLI